MKAPRDLASISQPAGRSTGCVTRVTWPPAFTTSFTSTATNAVNLHSTP